MKSTSKYLTWNSIRLKFVKKTSMLNPVKSLGYIKHYSSSSPRPVKSHSNSIRYNCQKICSWSRILTSRKPYWKSEKRTFLLMINNPIIYKFFKVSKTTKRRLTGWQFLTVDVFPTFLNTGTTNKHSSNLENKNLSDTYWRVQSTCMKVQAHSSLEQQLEYNQHQMPFMNQDWLTL